MSLIIALIRKNSSQILAFKNLTIPLGLDRLGNFSFFDPAYLHGEFICVGCAWQIRIYKHNLKFIPALNTTYKDNDTDAPALPPHGSTLVNENYSLIILKNSTANELCYKNSVLASAPNEFTEDIYTLEYRLGFLSKQVVLPLNCWIEVASSRWADIPLPSAFALLPGIKIKTSSTIVEILSESSSVAANGVLISGYLLLKKPEKITLHIISSGYFFSLSRTLTSKYSK